MALPLARLLLLPTLPACLCQPPLRFRFPKRHAAARRSHVSFVIPTTAYPRGNRAACAASASVAPPPAAPTEAEAEAEEPVGPRTRLVAQNIPWDCTADDMRALFEKHGSVVDVEVAVRSRPLNTLFV